VIHPHQDCMGQCYKSILEARSQNVFAHTGSWQLCRLSHSVCAAMHGRQRCWHGMAVPKLKGWLACRRSVLALLSTAESHPLLPVLLHLWQEPTSSYQRTFVCPAAERMGDQYASPQ
jgi:hypothetical protein